MEKQRDFKILNGFIIKIMAIIFMTIDHIGYFVGEFTDNYALENACRIIGRLAFPLFIFLLVEGVIHTKNTAKYFIRLGLLALAFFLGQLFYYFFISKNSVSVSPAVDLILTASCVYFLRRKDWYSLLALIPLAIAIVSVIVKNYEITHVTKIAWWPIFIRPDYFIYGPLLGIGFYYANDLAIIFLNSYEGTKSFIGTSFERTTKNIISAGYLIILTLLIAFIDRGNYHLVFSISWQFFALFAFIPILLYSGKRGYNAKWFQYGCYFYFPTHLVLLFLIFYLLF